MQDLTLHFDETHAGARSKAPIIVSHDRDFIAGIPD
jgi:ATPase subunit of ABC transporter with duplicated ATPase domains